MQENNKGLLSINNRIIQIVDFQNLTRYKFAQETGISDAVLFNIYKGKNKPSFDLIEKILNKYKAIDANWLLTGEGTMFKIEQSPNVLEDPALLYNKNIQATNSKSSTNEHSTINNSLLDKIIELSSENALLKKELEELKTELNK